MSIFIEILATVNFYLKHVFQLHSVIGNKYSLIYTNIIIYCKELLNKLWTTLGEYINIFIEINLLISNYQIQQLNFREHFYYYSISTFNSIISFRLIIINNMANFSCDPENQLGHDINID